MTEGVIWKQLVLFAIPLIMGNVFQQLYNTVDSIVVGNYLGTSALAAVGATTAICNTLVNFFNGISIGAGVKFLVVFRAKTRTDHQQLLKYCSGYPFCGGIPLGDQRCGDRHGDGGDSFRVPGLHDAHKNRWRP